MSCQRFIKLIDSEETEFLLENYPNCFLLLSYISLRARRTSNGLDGLEPGDSIIGEIESSKKCGLTTKQYRTALEKLEEFGFVETVFNPKNKSCQKRAIKKAIKSKVLNLSNSKIYDINKEDMGDQKGDLRANKGRSEGDKQERKERKKEKEVKKNVTLEEIDPSSSSVVPFSSFLQEENGIVPSEVRVFLENHKITLANADLEAWCALYDTEKVIETIQLMLNQKTMVKNPGAWLMVAFRDNYYQRDKNWKICQKFQLQFPFIKLKVLKSYAVASDNEELHYKMNQDELVRKLNLLIENQHKRA